MVRNTRSVTLVLLLSLVTAPYCRAETYKFFENRPLRQSFSYALGRNNGTGFEPFRDTAQFIYTFDMPEASAKTGIQLTSGTFDFTADGIWWFARGNKIRTGIGALYHYLLYEKISATNDFMGGLNMEIRPFSFFTISMEIDGQYKMDQIFAVKSHSPWITNFNPAFRFRLTYAPGNGAELYSEVASYEYFRYMLFFAPSFTFGAAYHWPDGVWAGMEIVPRYVDMMTISAYYDCTEIRAYFGFTF